MSQSWNGHWIEDAFKPTRLRNWEVPKWYPSWPDKHCTTTKFIADDRGHLLETVKRSKHSPWGDYKGTWDLPRRITRKVAEELSAPPQYKKDAWERHKIRNRAICQKVGKSSLPKDKVSTGLVKSESQAEANCVTCGPEVSETDRLQCAESKKPSCEVTTEKVEGCNSTVQQ